MCFGSNILQADERSVMAWVCGECRRDTVLQRRAKKKATFDVALLRVAAASYNQDKLHELPEVAVTYFISIVLNFLLISM